MATFTLREIMTNEIKDWAFYDCYFKRGDYNSRNYKTYKLWLESLCDDNFLSIYNNVREVYLCKQ